MKKRFPWSTVIFLLVLGFLAFSIVRPFVGPAPTVPRAGDVSNADRTSVPASGHDEQTDLPQGVYVGGNGVVEPAQPETKVAAQLSGRIAQVLVKEGDRVVAGQPLVRMEAAVEKAALDAAAADLATAQATFSRVAHGLRAEDVDAANAEAASAKARSDNSAEIYERTAKLAKDGVVTADELDRAKGAADSDAAGYKASLARAHAATAGSRYEDVAEAKSKVVAAQARRDQAQAMLDRLTVGAPIAGEILRVKYRDGEYYNVQGSEPLLILGDTSKLRVRMDVDERDVGKLKMGATAFAVADAYRGARFSGKVTEISRRMGRKNIRTDDPVERIDTKILEVVFDLDDPTQLVPGLRVMSYLDVAQK